VPSLCDHQRLSDADDAPRLPQDRLDAAGILVVACDLPCTLRRLQLVQANDSPFGFGHRLLREDDDVAVLELELRDDQLGEVVPFLDLRQPLDCDNSEFFQGRPVSLMPACAL
jgi:hypothetical protein